MADQTADLLGVLATPTTNDLLVVWDDSASTLKGLDALYYAPAASVANAITKTNFITISQAVDLDTLETLAVGALQDVTTEALESLSNVTITAPANTEVLTYSGGVWVNSAGGGGGAPEGTAVLSGGPVTDGYVLTANGAGGAAWESAPAGGSPAINDLSDITISSPADNEVLAFNGTIWVNQTAAQAGLLTTGGLTNYSIEILSDVNSMTPAAGDVLTHTGTAWTNSPVEMDALSDATISGVLADNELLAYDLGTTKWINQTPAEAGVASVSSMASTVSAAASALQDLSTEAIDGLANVVISAPADTEVLKYNGTNWVNSSEGTGGMANLLEDTTPQLGGDLDLNSHTIVNGTIGAQVSLRTDTLVNLLALGSAGVGEIAVPTDADALVVYKGTPGSAVGEVYYKNTVSSESMYLFYSNIITAGSSYILVQDLIAYHDPDSLLNLGNSQISTPPLINPNADVRQLEFSMECYSAYDPNTIGSTVHAQVEWSPGSDFWLPTETLIFTSIVPPDGILRMHCSAKVSVTAGQLAWRISFKHDSISSIQIIALSICFTFRELVT